MPSRSSGLQTIAASLAIFYSSKVSMPSRSSSLQTLLVDDDGNAGEEEFQCLLAQAVCRLHAPSGATESGSSSDTSFNAFWVKRSADVIGRSGTIVYESFGYTPGFNAFSVKRSA